MVPQERKSFITNIPPSIHKKPERNVHVWLEAKREDDNVEEGLWRIENTLYDLSDFIHKHPGGEDWIEMTRGHDITEAFITHHLRPAFVEPFLKKYRVRETTRPRNCKLTFKEDGFYMTLRRRVIAKLPEIKKSTKIWSNCYVDGLFTLTLISAICALRYHNYLFALFSGLTLTWVGISGHNFLHQRDNFRMRYLNMIMLNYRNWRISHVLSHHLFPNSLLDFEIVSFEPFWVWTIDESKSWIQKYASFLYSPILYLFVFPLDFVKRLSIAINKKTMMRPDDFLPFVVPVIMHLLGGDNSFLDALKFYAIIIMFGGFCFSIIAINGGHQHPEVLHDGDPMREDLDWGIYSVDTVMDRPEIRGSKFFALTSFADHGLHHLFPTIDAGYLPELYVDFYKTMIEFEVECACRPWFFEFITGQFQQLIREEPQKLNTHEKYLLNNGKESSNLKND